MHSLITGFAEVDHWDLDGLNNQRENLREGVDGRNARNQRAHRDSTSRFKGVCFDPRRGRWRAVLRNSHLGYFADELEAAAAYDAAAQEVFGEFARLNLA
jgi:hypothetical protein